MHASRCGGHLSGAERLGGEEDLAELAVSLLRRALDHPRGRAEQVRLTVEAVAPEAVRTGRLPDLTTLTVEDFRQGRRAALALLIDAGIDPAVASRTLLTLASGAGLEGGSMRGAMLIDAADGRRLEPDPSRGVRASRMDLTPAAALRLREKLAPLGLDNPHVREALVLAAKVLSAPGIVAELCWSDDPDYTAGYVASPTHGYVRFPHLKSRGDERGGRAFFLRSEALELEAVIDYLEQSVFLVDEIGALHGPRPWEE